MRIKDFFEPFIDYKIKEGCDPHTIKEYRRFIRETLSCIGEKRISDLRITDKVDIMEQGRKHGYWGEQRAISTFVNFLKYLNGRGERLSFR